MKYSIIITASQTGETYHSNILLSVSFNAVVNTITTRTTCLNCYQSAGLATTELYYSLLISMSQRWVKDDGNLNWDISGNVTKANQKAMTAYKYVPPGKPSLRLWLRVWDWVRQPKVTHCSSTHCSLTHSKEVSKSNFLLTHSLFSGYSPTSLLVLTHSLLTHSTGDWVIHIIAPTRSYLNLLPETTKLCWLNTTLCTLSRHI